MIEHAIDIFCSRCGYPLTGLCLLRCPHWGHPAGMVSRRFKTSAGPERVLVAFLCVYAAAYVAMAFAIV